MDFCLQHLCEGRTVCLLHVWETEEQRLSTLEGHRESMREQGKERESPQTYVLSLESMGNTRELLHV